MKLRDIACVSGLWFLYVFVPLLKHILLLLVLDIIGILESLSTNQHERIDPAHLEMMTSI